ncbi:MAG TPA: Stp1/IreP family PP2C-type Ser/Thr phosphatase [Terriglobales bacterium]
MQGATIIERASLSDVGCQRGNNEDSCGYWEPQNPEALASKGRLAIIADGMGGHEGGQEASRIAVETIEQTYAANADRDPRSALLEGFRNAHQRIQEYGRVHPGLHGMGTTATAVALFPTQLLYAHIGDSRLYLIHANNITQLTRDHSYVSHLVQSGVITEDEAEIHPGRHILTAALGAGLEAEPEIAMSPIPVASGDRLVLCTDGLWSLMEDEEILDTVLAHDPVAACNALVEMAKQRGGPDNITVQVLYIP